MSVPKFLNAHHSLKATERCTRAQIFGDDEGIKDKDEGDASGGAEACHVRGEKLHQDQDKDEGKGLGDVVRWLEAYLRDSLVYAPPSLEDEDEGVARPGKRRRKKLRTDDEEKREGEGAGAGDDSDAYVNASTGPSTSVFEFRLLSGRKTPREIDVLPRPSQIQSIEREYEDTPTRASLRTKQALEVAVDFDWVLKQSSTVPIPSAPNQVCFPHPMMIQERTQDINLLDLNKLNPTLYIAFDGKQAGRRVNINGKDKRKELVVTPNSDSTSASTPTPTPTPALLGTSNLFIVELPKSHVGQPARARTRRHASWEPSPHELKKKSRLCCPLIAFSSPALSVRTSSDAEEENTIENGRRGRRRRRKRARRSGSGSGKGERERQVGG